MENEHKNGNSTPCDDLEFVREPSVPIGEEF